MLFPSDQRTNVFLFVWFLLAEISVVKLFATDGCGFGDGRLFISARQVAGKVAGLPAISQVSLRTQ